MVATKADSAFIFAWAARRETTGRKTLKIIPENARAVIEWRSAGGTPTAAMRRAFDTAGYDLVIGAAPTRFARQPDLAVIDLRRADDPAAAMRRLAHSAHASGAPCGIVVYLNPEQRAEIEDRWPRRTLVESAQPPATLMRAIDARLRLGRLGEAAAGRLQALAAIDALHDWPAPIAAGTTLNILIAGPPAATALALMNALTREGAEVSTAFSAAQIMHALEHMAFDAVVIQPRTRDDLIVMLGRSLKRQARRRTLPVFLIEDELDDDSPARAGDSLVSLQVNAAPRSAAREICRAADLRRRHETLRSVLSLLEAQKPDAGADAGKEYFLAQTEFALKRRIATKAPVGAITIRLSHDGASAALNGQKNRLAHHVLRNTFRLQDTIFEVDAGLWIALCPHAPENALPDMAERVRVIAASLLPGSAPLVGSVTLETHEKAPEFIARALRAVRPIRKSGTA